MSKGLDVGVLRTFLAVARLGRFKEAAAYVNRSPSAVTAQIQKLENTVGQRLLMRNNQTVELTRAGRHLLAETTQFLLAHDRLAAAMAPNMVSGRVRLGVPDGYAARFISDFLPVFVAGNPRLELIVEARSSGELLTMFARQQLDLTIAVSQQGLGHGELLFTIQPRWMAATHFKHDASRPIPIALQLKGCPYRESALTVLREHRIDYRILLESANWQAIDACIKSGLAWGIVEAPDLQDSLQVSVNDMNLPFLPAHYVYLMSDSANPLALHFHDVLKSKLHNTGGFALANVVGKDTPSATPGA